jgi:hypothetical protein
VLTALAILNAPPRGADLAPAVARALGVTAFEANQVLRGTPPWVLLKTPDAAKAARLATELASAGVIAVELATVPTTETMHEVRGFAFEPDALVSLNQNGTSERLPWAEVSALVRGFRRVATTDVEVHRERKFDLGRAVLTQGLVLSKTEKKVTETHGEAREPIVYLLRRGGAPWFTTESRCRYDGLGPLLKPARVENFNTVVKQLQARLPQVPFDDRLLKARSHSPEEVDLLVHLIGLQLVTPSR